MLTFLPRQVKHPHNISHEILDDIPPVRGEADLFWIERWTCSASSSPALLRPGYGKCCLNQSATDEATGPSDPT